jgi:NAD+ kinase
MPAPNAPARFARVALVGRQASPELAAPLAQLAAYLAARGHQVVLDAETARYASVPAIRAPAVQLAANSDLAIVLGGDGDALDRARWRRSTCR